MPTFKQNRASRIQFDPTVLGLSYKEMWEEEFADSLVVPEKKEYQISITTTNWVGD